MRTENMGISDPRTESDRSRTGLLDLMIVHSSDPYREELIIIELKLELAMMTILQYDEILH